MITDINSEDRLVQETFADHLSGVLGWESIFAHNDETFGPNGTLGRASEREVVLVRDLRAAVQRLNRDLPESAREHAVEKLTRVDFARSLIQHNREFYDFIRNGVPVEWRDAGGQTRHARARVIDFANENALDGTPRHRLNAAASAHLMFEACCAAPVGGAGGGLAALGRDLRRVLRRLGVESLGPDPGADLVMAWDRGLLDGQRTEGWA